MPLACKIEKNIVLTSYGDLTLLSKIDPSPNNMRAIILQKYMQVHMICTI